MFTGGEQTAPDVVVPYGEPGYVAVSKGEGQGGGSKSEGCSACQQAKSQVSQPSRGKPVNTATGDEWDTSTDMSVRGAGLPLAFTRTYDADLAQQEAGSTPVSPGPLGYGWTDNLGMTVSYNSSASPPVATVTEENGAEITFNPTADVSNSWCVSTINFCPTSPRIIASLSQGSGGSGWTFTRELGGNTTFTFNSSGALTNVEDATGDQLQPTTESAGTGKCPSGATTCTAWASVPAGESAEGSLTLAYDATGQLVSVTDSAGNETTFCYYGQSCASGAPSGGGQTNDLYEATDNATSSTPLTTSYTYNESNSNAVLQHDLMTVTPPGATVSGLGQTQNQYNSSGQISQQTQPDGEVDTYAYAGSEGTVAGGTTTVVSYPEGTGSGEPSTTTIYSYDDGVLNAETVNGVTEYFNRDPVSLLSISTQDLDGNQSSATVQTGAPPSDAANIITTTDAEGNTSADAYTSFNQPWCEIDAADYANGTRCPSSEPSWPPTTSYPGVIINYYNTTTDELIATTDPLGDTTTYTYTSGVSGVPNGLQYCSVDPVDYHAGVTCPAYGATHVAGTTTETFNAAGNTLTSTNADGDTTSYSYGDSSFPWLPTQTTDPDGTVTTDTYNTVGQVAEQVVSFGSYSATTVMGYDSDGRQYCTIAPLAYSEGHTTCPTAPTSPPTAGSDPWPGDTITIYNANSQPTYSVNPLGGVTQTAYDGAGDVYCTVSPREYAATVTCPAYGTAQAGATITAYDALGQVTQVTNPLGGVTSTPAADYDAQGNLLESEVESNNSTADPTITTAYTYDADNRVATTTVDPGSSLQATTMSSFDPNGNVFCSVSAKASSGSYVCPTWQADWITAPPSPSSLYPTLADDVTTSFADADGDVVQSTNPDVDTTVTAYDLDGQSYCTIDPTNTANGTTCPSYETTKAGTSTTVYDDAGNKLSTTDQDGDTTSYTYDPAGHVLTTTDPRGKVTTNCYYDENGSGQCAAGAPAGGGSGDELYSTTTPATTADPSGETTTYSYFAGGEADVTTTPAGTTTDSYDPNGDLTSETYGTPASGYSAAPQVSYTYNVDGSRATMTDGTGTTSYTYDGAGDTTEQALNVAGGSSPANATTSYSYFSTGVLDTETYPSYAGHSDPTVTYTYDGTGAMAGETDWLGNEVMFGHDADGNETSQDNAVSTSDPSGTSSTSFAYDAADENTGATSTMACSSGNETLTQSFSPSGEPRNPDGLLTEATASYTDSCSPSIPPEVNYSYDAAGRVVYQGTSPQGSNPANFAYDASGDPTTISSHDASNNFDTYTDVPDNAGETTSQTPISGSHGVTSTFTYDTLGAQTGDTAGSISTTDAYTQLGQMATNLSTNPTNYTYTGDGLEAATATTKGLSWAAASSIDGTKVINAVSCASASFCAAVGNTGDLLTYNGTSWTKSSTTDGTRAINAVSCPTPTFCMAVDNSGYDVVYNGTSWTVSSSTVDGHPINGVSCTSATFCIAVDNVGFMLSYSASGWTTYSSKIDSGNALEAVSCPTSSFCAAVDNAGRLFRSTNPTSTSSWTVAHNDGTKTINAVSCSSPSSCVAVDNKGKAFYWNGTGWSSSGTSVTSNALESVSCLSSSYCIAVDNNGDAWTDNASSWTSVSIDGTKTVNGVSCSATLFSCAAVDANGNAIVDQAPKQLVWDTNGSLALILSDGTNDYLYGPTGEPVEQIALASSAPTFMTYVASNSSWLLTNATGDETAFYQYDAFGTLSFGTPASPFGYAGQYADASSGLDNMRARWFEPQTGEFTTRDPAFAQTDQAYAYAGDDPVNESDPSGLATVGICAGFNVALPPFNLGAGDCLTRTVDASGEDDIGLTGTAFGGVGLNVGAGVSFYYEVSNAANLQELGQWFTFANVTADVFGGATLTVFWNNQTSGNVIYGIEVGMSLGAELSVTVGESYTWVDKFNGTISANIARGAWDAFNPGLAITRELDRAKRAIRIAQSPPSTNGATSC